MSLNHELINIPIGKENVSVTVYDSLTEKTVGELILTPAFGITARSMFSFAYYLSSNGFKVYCLDYRNHVGKSSGEIIDCKLSTQAEDLLAVIKETNCRKIVSISLSCRSTIKCCALLNEEVELVMITPVVNTANTISCAANVDYFEIVKDDSDLNQEADILGNLVKYYFVKDAKENNFDSLESTMDDLKKVKGKITMIAGNLDPWVKIDEVKNVVDSTKSIPVELTIINAAAHKINRNPVVAAKYYEEATRECLKNAGMPYDNICIPNLKEIIREIGRRGGKNE